MEQQDRMTKRQLQLLKLHTPKNTSCVLINEILPENNIAPITKGTKKGPAIP